MKNKLKYLRKLNGISQNALAKLVKVSRQTISSIERGVYNPSIVLAINIAKNLNTSVEKIFIID